MNSRPEERRKLTDHWIIFARILALGGWGLFILALVMSYYASPEFEYGLVKYYGIEVRKFWLTPLTGYLYIVLWVSALSSYLCLIIDKYRSRRAADSSHFNAILLFIISIVWVVYIIIHIKDIN